MAEGISDDQASKVFDLVLDELSKSRENLVKEITVAAESGDYNAIAELMGRLKRADILKNELERLQEEWQSVFHPEAVQTELPKMPSAGNPPAIVVPDQYELCSPTLQALRTLSGRGRIWEIDETVIDQMQLPEEVTRQLHEGGPQTELEWQLGWARTILKTCGMIDNPQQGSWELTESGSRQQWLEAAVIKSLYRQRLDQRRQRAGS